MTPIKVAQFGLGPIGIETLKLAASKPWAQIVGGIDVDPGKIGRNLGEVIGLSELVWGARASRPQFSASRRKHSRGTIQTLSRPIRCRYRARVQKNKNDITTTSKFDFA